MRLLADENFDNDIVRGVMRSNPDIDFVRAQEVGLSGAADPEVLAWAANENRVLLSHDVATITKYAYERIEAGLPMPGVFEVAQTASIKQIIDDILLLAECSLENEWQNQVRYLPLR